MHEYDTLKEKQLDDEICALDKALELGKNEKARSLTVELNNDGTAKVIINNMEAYDALLAISAIIRTVSQSVGVKIPHILKDLKGLTKVKK